MARVTKKEQVMIPKERKSLLSLGGVAKGRKIGPGDERVYTKKTVARKIVREGR